MTPASRLAEAVEALLKERGLLMHMLTNKPNPWTPPVYQDYYDVKAEAFAAVESALAAVREGK